MLSDMMERWKGFLPGFPVAAAEIAVFILICIVLFSIYRFYKVRKMGCTSLESKMTKEMLGMKELEQQMIHLADGHQNVKKKKCNFIISRYNQAAYKKLNSVRNSISETSADIISLVSSARWLFDNFQMMYREIKKVKTTGTSYESLPILRKGEYRGIREFMSLQERWLISREDI